MADITTFYPGGSGNTAVGHAGEADMIDDQNETTPLFLWSGTMAEYEAIVTAETATPGTHPNFARTIYYTT